MTLMIVYVRKIWKQTRFPNLAEIEGFYRWARTKKKPKKNNNKKQQQRKNVYFPHSFQLLACKSQNYKIKCHLFYYFKKQKHKCNLLNSKMIEFSYNFSMIYTKPWPQVGPTYPGTQPKQCPVLTSHILSWQFVGHGMLQFDPL